MTIMRSTLDTQNALRFARFALTVVVVLMIPSAAKAQGGLFDFLDPCIAAGEAVSQNRSQVLSDMQASIQQAGTQEPTPEFAKLWWKEVRKNLRVYYNANVAPQLPKGLSAEQKDRAFKMWLDYAVKEQGGWPALNKLIKTEWARLRDAEISQARTQIEGALDAQDRELRSHCSADFGNQFLRGSMTVITAPFAAAARNVEIAKRENTLVGQILAVPTGISVTDIGKHGALGGDGSDARKAADFVARTFGFKW
jgi:hypothetical protein